MELNYAHMTYLYTSPTCTAVEQLQWDVNFVVGRGCFSNEGYLLPTPVSVSGSRAAKGGLQRDAKRPLPPSTGAGSYRTSASPITTKNYRSLRAARLMKNGISSNLTRSANARKQATPFGAQRIPPASSARIGTKGLLSSASRRISPLNKAPSEGLDRPSPSPERTTKHIDKDISSSPSSSSAESEPDPDDADGGDQSSALLNLASIRKVFEKVRGRGGMGCGARFVRLAS